VLRETISIGFSICTLISSIPSITYATAVATTTSLANEVHPEETRPAGRAGSMISQMKSPRSAWQMELLAPSLRRSRPPEEQAAVEVTMDAPGAD
jgi:hypothetical protein